MLQILVLYLRRKYSFICKFEFSICKVLLVNRHPLPFILQYYWLISKQLAESQIVCSGWFVFLPDCLFVRVGQWSSGLLAG